MTLPDRWPEWRAANRARWDERVAIHQSSRFYDVDGFLAGADPLRGFETDEMGPVEGCDLVHLQCHFGLDTLGWARRGARVTGLDFSEPAIVAARDLAERAGLADTSEFVVADVYDAVEALGGRTFDVVYTGLGAIGWLPDIVAWAHVCASLVRPGGRFYLAEFHPFSWVFADEDLTVAYPYFQSPDEPLELEEVGTYTDATVVTTANWSYEWSHPISSIINALLGAGLVLDGVWEHDHTLFERWPFLEVSDTEPGIYRLPDHVPPIPLIFSLRCRRSPA